MSYYDLSQGDLSSLQPVHTWSDHTALISCVTSFLALPDLVASGSRDGTIRIWDRRTSICAGLLGGDSPAHGSDIVTTIAASSTLVISTGTDGFMNLWDLRQLGSQGPNVQPLSRVSADGTAILKVALAGSPSENIAAVTTFSGEADLTGWVMSVHHHAMRIHIEYSCDLSAVSVVYQPDWVCWRAAAL